MGGQPENGVATARRQAGVELNGMGCRDTGEPPTPHCGFSGCLCSHDKAA
jgi:hypothetical protein